MGRNLKYNNLKMKTKDIFKIIIKKKKIRIPIYICLCIISIFCVSKLSVAVSAKANDFETYYEIGIGENTYDFTDLLTKYRTNSVSYKRNMLDYRIQALNSNLADENHADINSQHVDIIEKIEELNQAKKAWLAYKNDLLSQKSQVVTVTGSAITKETATIDDNQELINEIDLQIMNIESQLLQYSSTRGSLETSLSDAQLSKSISNFYSKYQSLIENEAKNRMENEFLKQCYSLIIYKEEQDYYKAYHEYLALIKDVDIIRYRYGLVTAMELDVAEVNILQNERVIIENENTYEAGINAIKRDTKIMDESKIKLFLPANKIKYDIESTIQEFINRHSGYQQIQNYIRSYQEYRSTARIGSYTSYRQTELRIDYYKLQREELEDSIRAYVIQAINSYEKALKSRETAWKELQIKSDQYNALVTKLKYKRASQLELAKSLYEKEAAEVAYYQSYYESVIWQDILDSHIYGAMP